MFVRLILYGQSIISSYCATADDKYHIPEYAPNYYPKFDNPHADMLMSISNEMALHASRRCKAEAQTVIGTHLWRKCSSYSHLCCGVFVEFMTALVITRVHV